MLSERLLSWQATPTSLEVTTPPARRGWAVVRMELRPDMRGRLDPAVTLFDQENQLMMALEAETERAIAWDDARFADHLDAFGVSHYCVDPARVDVVRAALVRRPPLAADARARMLGSYRLPVDP